MFLQVALPQKDQTYFCFLWKQSQEGPPLEYIYERHVFGAKGSPFLAIEVTCEHARENEELYPRAAEAVLCSTVVDDVLDS